MRQWTADSLEPIIDDDSERVYRGYDSSGSIGYSGGRSLPDYPGDPTVGDLTLWDLNTGERIAAITEGFNWSLLGGGDLTAATDDLLFAVFHDERALLGIGASDGGQRTVLINTRDGSIIRSFEDALAASLASAAFLDATTLLSATHDDRLVLWSSADGSFIREVAALSQAVAQMEASPDSRTVFGRAADGSAVLWRLNESVAAPAATYTGALPGTALSPSGQRLLLVNDSGATLLSTNPGGADETISQFDASLVSSAGAVFAVYAGDRVTLHDIETGAELQRWSVDWNDAQQMYLSHRGGLLLAQAEGALWLLQAGVDAPLALSAGPPLQVAFAADGASFLTLQAERALLWDAATGQALGAFPLGAESAVELDLAFSADGETLYFFVRLESGLAGLTAVTVADQTVRRRTYLDVAHGELSPDGEFLLLARRAGGLQIVGAANGEMLRALPVEAAAIQSLRLLPEPGLLLTSSGQDLTVWDTAAAAIEQQFTQARPPG